MSIPTVHASVQRALIAVEQREADPAERDDIAAEVEHDLIRSVMQDSPPRYRDIRGPGSIHAYRPRKLGAAE